jgi:hypothetical protein
VEPSKNFDLSSVYFSEGRYTAVQRKFSRFSDVVTDILIKETFVSL